MAFLLDWPVIGVVGPWWA